MKQLILAAVIISYGCASLQGFKKTDFTYQQEQKKQNLQLQVPKGYADEKIVLDTTGGKELYYYYESGALLYFSKKISWPTENAAFIAVKSMSQKNHGQVFTYKGVDKDGLHWKEIHIDDFRFGYSYVPANALEKFEQALNSLRYRN